MSDLGQLQVIIGFLLVLLAGSSLAGASVTLGLRDPICRAQSLQLVYLTIVLTVCSILTLLFNSSVLRIAKKQLNAIYAHQPTVLNTRRISLFCTNCGHKNATFVSSLHPVAPPSNDTMSVNASLPDSSTLVGTSGLPILPITLPISVPLADPMVLSPLHLESQYQQNQGSHFFNPPSSSSDDPNASLESTPLTLAEQGHSDENPMSPGPLIRTVSLPTLPEAITLLVPPDPIVPPTTILLANSAVDIMENTVKINASASQLSNSVTFPHTIKVALPRSRSFTCAKKTTPVATTPRHHHLFRGLHFTRSHMFHVSLLIVFMEVK